MAFKELVHKILEWIKNEPYFWWLSKMGGDLAYIAYTIEKRGTLLNNEKYLRIIWSSW